MVAVRRVDARHVTAVAPTPAVPDASTFIAVVAVADEP
jgi:hypothetical protein